MRVNGKTIKYMGEEFTPGQMEENMKEIENLI